MARPTTHRWMPFYVWFLFAGAVSAILPIFRALNLSGSGGYIFLGLLLTAIRAVAWWGLFTRKLWGWYLNFGALFAIPVLKGLIVLKFSGNYNEAAYGPSMCATVILWVIYAVPNVVYFLKRKYLFDDGKGPYKTLFEKGWGFRVLDPYVASESSVSDVPLPSVAGQVPATAEVDSLVENVSVKSDDCILNNDKWEDIAMVNLSDKSDEQFYEIAQREFDAGDIAKGLMLKAEVATGGDAGKARLLYIRTRAQELANEEKSLAVLREAFSDAVKGEKSADKFLKRIEQFRADYPDNAKISELQAEFECQRLEARIKALLLEEVYPTSARSEKCIQMYDSFLEQNPKHSKRLQIEQNRSKYASELAEFRDRNAFYTMKGKAEELVGKHEYQAAADLYKKYMDEHGASAECMEKARKMVEETIPKLIADEPARKRRAKRNLVIGATIVVVLVFIIGFFVSKGEQEAKLSREKSEQEDRLKSEQLEQEAKLCAESYRAGLEQKIAKDYAAALKSFRTASDLGNFQAAYEIGLLYLEGNGVSRDSSEAGMWLKKASKGGNKDASDKLAELFSLGKIKPESGPSDDFWPLVDLYSPGSREMNRTSNSVWVAYLDTVDKQTGLKNRQRAEAAMSFNNPRALAAIFDECWSLSKAAKTDITQAGRVK